MNERDERGWIVGVAEDDEFARDTGRGSDWLGWSLADYVANTGI